MARGRTAARTAAGPAGKAPEAAAGRSGPGRGPAIRHEGRRLTGVSIALKLALVTAALVALFMGGFAGFLRGFVRDALSLQIKLAAHEAAWVGAHADVIAWSEYFATPLQGLSVEEVATRAAAMSPREYDQTFRGAGVVAQREWNAGRLARLIPRDRLGRIIAAEVWIEEGGRRRLLPSYTGAMSFAPRMGDVSPPFLRGTAAEGLLAMEGRREHVIRGSVPMLRADGSESGEFAVYISAGALDEAVASITMQVVLTGAVLAFLGGLVAWGAGRALMAPLRGLQGDVRIVAGGDLDHRTGSTARDEIGALARAFDHMTEELAAASRRERDTAASRHQMSVAGEVAASLFPARLPELPGWGLAGHHEASGQLTGEIYDVLPMPGGRLGLAVAAASGSGVPAAMVMAMARSTLAAVARRSHDPGEILREVNALLSGDLRRGMYVTVLLAVLDPEGSELHVANAGHAPLLLRRAATGKVEPVHSEGIALGFDKGPVFDATLRVVRLALQPGDAAMLYTPGVTRLGNEAGEPLGEARFAALVQREAALAAPDCVRRMAAILRKFRGERAQSEDVTLLALSRRA